MPKVKQELDNLRQKDLTALRRELTESQQTLQKSRVELAFGRLPNVSTINRLRRQIARVQTIISEKEASNA